MCWSTSRFYILINGTPDGFFRGTRGLRQGDLISPLIFSPIAESLTQFFKAARENSMLKRFAIKEGGKEIIVLQYMDDTMVFLDDSLDMVANLKCMMYWFDVVSGLHITSKRPKSVVYLEHQVSKNRSEDDVVQ